MKIFYSAILLAGASTASNAAPPEAFSVCSGCHVTTKGAQPTIGPNLFGVTQRKSGEAPGYNYSPAMKKAALPWTSANLEAFVMHPQKTVPGTKMPYGGQMDAGKASAIVAYLETLK